MTHPTARATEAEQFDRVSLPEPPTLEQKRDTLNLMLAVERGDSPFVSYSELLTYFLAQRDAALSRAEQAERELAREKKINADSCKDWADDDDAINKLVLPIIGQATIDGDSYSVPGIVEKVEKVIATLTAQRDEARREAEVLRAVVEEALEPGVFGPWCIGEDPILARSNLLQLCESVGYGAVMHYTEYLWNRKAKDLGHPGSEHTCAAAAAVRHGWIKRATDALARREGQDK